MNHLRKNVRHLMESGGHTPSTLAAASGAKQPNIFRIVEGQIDEPRVNTIQPLADYWGIPVVDLIYKDLTEMAVDKSNVTPGPDMKGKVPLISNVQAGTWCEAQDQYTVGDAEEWLPCPVRHGPRTYALRVQGESMRNPGSKPSFEDGDIIFVDPDLGATHKSLVITKLDDSNEVNFKRLLIDGQSWYLEALNPAWPNRIIPIKVDAHLCGIVIARLESFI